MATFVEDFVEMLDQPPAVWSKLLGSDIVEGQVVETWGAPQEIRAIFKPTRRIVDSRTGSEIVKPATFKLGPEPAIEIGDKIEFRGHTYVVENVADIDWFGGEFSGCKYECRQMGGVPRP